MASETKPFVVDDVEEEEEEDDDDDDVEENGIAVGDVGDVDAEDVDSNADDNHVEPQAENGGAGGPRDVLDETTAETAVAIADDPEAPAPAADGAAADGAAAAPAERPRNARRTVAKVHSREDIGWGRARSLPRTVRPPSYMLRARSSSLVARPLKLPGRAPGRACPVHAPD